MRRIMSFKLSTQHLIMLHLSVRPQSLLWISVRLKRTHPHIHELHPCRSFCILSVHIREDLVPPGPLTPALWLKRCRTILVHFFNSMTERIQTNYITVLNSNSVLTGKPCNGLLKLHKTTSMSRYHPFMTSKSNVV